MQANRLLIAALLLAGLGGSIWWTNRQPAESIDTSKVPNNSVKLMSLLEADLTEVKVQIKGEAPRIYRKDLNSQKWNLVSEQEKDPSYRTDGEAVMNVINSSSTFPTDKMVDENATDLIQYGLDPPQIVVDIKDKNGKAERVHLGDDTPVGQMAYAAKPGSKKVYTVAKYLKEGISKSAFDVRDKHLLPLDEAKVTRMEWSRKGEALEFGKNAQGEWQILKPEPMRVDNLAAGELFRKAKDAKYEFALTPEATRKNAADFAAASPVGSIKLGDAASTQSLEVRKTKDGAYLAKASGVSGIYPVTEELGTGLDKSADDFRNKKLFDFGHDEIASIEFKKEGKPIVLEKKGEDWLLAGKKADASSVATVVDQLRIMQGMKFVKKAMGPVSIEISVKPKGKNAEKLLVSAIGNFRYAQRAGEATEFEVDPKVLTDLEAALQAVSVDGQKKK